MWTSMSTESFYDILNKFKVFHTSSNTITSFLKTGLQTEAYNNILFIHSIVISGVLSITF